MYETANEQTLGRTKALSQYGLILLPQIRQQLIFSLSSPAHTLAGKKVFLKKGTNDPLLGINPNVRHDKVIEKSYTAETKLCLNWWPLTVFSRFPKTFGLAYLECFWLLWESVKQYDTPLLDFIFLKGNMSTIRIQSRLSNHFMSAIRLNYIDVDYRSVEHFFIRAL